MNINKMQKYIVFDIYQDKKVTVSTIKEDDKCFKLWENILTCLEKGEDCTKKFIKWDKCNSNQKK